MELRHLRHFVALAEARNFTRAAADLHIVQSALSTSIQSFERELGSRLFDRTTHSVDLTDAGRVLLPEARHTLAAAEAAIDAVAAVKGGLRGTLRIGIMQSLSVVDLAGILTAFHRRWPDVELQPHPANGGSAQLCEQITSGILDVAFVGIPPERCPPGLHAVPLATEELVLLRPSDEACAREQVALTELEGRHFIDLPKGWGVRESVDELCARMGITRVITIEITDVPNMTDLVRAGFGIALIAPSMLPHSRKLTISRVTPAPNLTVSLVTAQTRRSAATEAFMNLATSGS